MKKRIISLLMALVLAFSLLPTAAFAADHADQVRVIVENTTYTAADAPWTGTLVDKWVDLKSDSTVMSCVVDALGSYPQSGASSGYISEINEGRRRRRHVRLDGYAERLVHERRLQRVHR